MIKTCQVHGETDFVFRNNGKQWKCRKCNVEYVHKSRKKRKEKLVELAGGKCSLCGYDKYLGALQFHHLEPTQKKFCLGMKSPYSLDRCVEESKKCVLLCANCHAEVEGNISFILINKNTEVS